MSERNQQSIELFEGIVTPARNPCSTYRVERVHRRRKGDEDDNRDDTAGSAQSPRED